MRRSFFGMCAAAVLLLLVITAPAAFAHVGRHIAGFDVEVGWATEPVLVGFPNGVFFEIHDEGGRPVTDVGDRLKVEVSFGDQKGPTLVFEPTEEPGRYSAAIIPTRPGSYTFRLTGTVRGATFNSTFDKVEQASEPADIKFPVKDPSLGEIAALVERLGPRIDALGPRLDKVARVADKADSAGNLNRILAITAVALAAAALVAALRRPTTRSRSGGS